jgi:hypothetical protein
MARKIITRAQNIISLTSPPFYIRKLDVMGSLTSASFWFFSREKIKIQIKISCLFPEKLLEWSCLTHDSSFRRHLEGKVDDLARSPCWLQPNKIKNKIITKHFWRVFSVEGKVDSLSAVHTHTNRKFFHISLYIAYKGGSARLILFVLIPFSASALIRASGYYWMARAEQELVLFGALTHSNRFLSPPRTSPHHSREGGGKAKKGPRNEKCVYL